MTSCIVCIAAAVLRAASRTFITRQALTRVIVGLLKPKSLMALPAILSQGLFTSVTVVRFLLMFMMMLALLNTMKRYLLPVVMI